MGSISFGGISTGIPTDQMVEAILAERSSSLTRLQSRQTTNNQKKNVLQSIKTAMSNLATSVASLTSAKLNGRTVTSTDSAAVTATSSGGVAGSYDLVVKQLAAKARTETTKSFGSPDESVGTDPYFVTGKNGLATEIKLEAGKDSLADLSAAINAKSGDTGVTSSIVQKKPGEYHLVLSSTETGVGQGESDTISIYGQTGNALGVEADGTGATATGAKNAVFTLDGVQMERTSNTVSDAVDGLTFTMNRADNKNISLKVSTDTDSVVKAYQDVVDKYNAALQVYKTNSAAGKMFSGDVTMQSMFSQLKSSLSGSFQGEDGEIWSSAILGVSTNKDGTLSLDTKKLEDALKANPDAVGKVFDRISNGTKTFIDSLTTSGSGTITNMINSIDTLNTNLSKQIDTIQARMDRQRETLTAQFAKLESLIGQMQSAAQSLSGLYTA